MASRNSRYRIAPVIRYGEYLYYGLRDRIDTSVKADDHFYTVEPEDDLQKVAYKTLGSAELWWVVAEFNDVLDPFVPLVPGTQLRVPSSARLWMEVIR